MKRFKSLTLLMVVAFLFATAQEALAGQVTRIYKKRSVVRVNEGTATGFEKGARICFFSPAGRRVACGKVQRATSNAAFVRVPKKRLSRIRKGFEATMATGKSSSQTQIVAADKGIDHRNNIKLGYVYTALAPAQFNKLNYRAPENQDETVDSLWNAQGVSSSSLVGAITEGEFGIGQSLALSIGLRYRIYRSFVGKTDYNKELSQLSKYVEVEQSASAFGLYSDLTFLDVAFSPTFFFRMSSGLDIDQSNVQFVAIQKEDNVDGSNKIASYTSSLMVASLRLGLNFNLLVAGPFGMVMGTNAIVPLAAFGKNVSAEVNDPQAEAHLNGGAERAKEDLTKGIGHQKSSFGAEAYFMLYLAF